MLAAPPSTVPTGEQSLLPGALLPGQQAESALSAPPGTDVLLEKEKLLRRGSGSRSCLSCVNPARAPARRAPLGSASWQPRALQHNALLHLKRFKPPQGLNSDVNNEAARRDNGAAAREPGSTTVPSPGDGNQGSSVP